MKINYILSDTTKKATTTSLERIVSRAEKEPLENFIVLVPETKSIIIEKELLSLSKTGAIINVYVYTFVRLINRLGLISDDKIANKQTAIMLIRKVIFENIDNLVCYKKTAKTSGFAEKIYETIALFKSSNLSVDDLELSLETKNEALKQKLKDLILIYREYEKALGETLFDDQDKLALVGKFAKTSELIKNSHIFAVGFDNITYEMKDVLKEFATHSKSITFSSVYFSENRSDKYIQKNELYKKFTAVADELKYPYNPTFVKTYSAGDFYNIANHLFSLNKTNVKSNGNVKVFEASSSLDEIEFVANMILKEVEADKRYRDIGVMVNGLELLSDKIREVFDRYKIPYFINLEHDLNQHFYVKFIKDAFLCINSSFSAENVLVFMANPLFFAKNYSAVYQFVSESGINYNRFLKSFDDEKLVKNENFEMAKPDLEKFQDFAIKLKQKLSENSTINEFLDIYDFINNYFNLNDKLQEIAKFEREQNLEIESQITEKIFEKVKKYILMLKNFMGNVKIPLHEFLLEFFSGLGSVKLNLIPVSIDTVVIQSNTDGFFNIKDLFIVNATEGNFPACISDSGIILDSELAEAKSFSKKTLEPSVKQINARENFRVYEAFLEPKEKLFVSFALKDLSGSITKPARIVTRLINLFGNEILFRSYEKFSCPSINVLEYELSKDIGKFFANEIQLHELNSIYGKIENNINENLKKYLQNLNFSNDDFEIKMPDKLYFLNSKTSVSQLERYFACPYQFFAVFGLRLKENKSAKLSSLDVGLIVHRVAELFIKNVNGFETLNSNLFEEKVIELIKIAVDENQVYCEYNESILNFVKSECLRLCRYLFYERQNSGFKTMKNGTEFVFSGENAIFIPISNGETISVEGKIDRIDEWGEYIRIVDYKTGDVSSDLSSVYFGKKIQLVSYLSAVINLNGKKVAGLFYLPIHSEFTKQSKKPKNMYKFEGFLLDDIEVVKNMDFCLSFENPESNFVSLKIKVNKKNINENKFEISGSSSKNLTESEFDNIREYTLELCREAISEIKCGNIEPSPISSLSEDTPTICTWCKFSGFCGLKNSKFPNGRIIDGAVSASSFKLKDGSEENNG